MKTSRVFTGIWAALLFLFLGAGIAAANPAAVDMSPPFMSEYEALRDAVYNQKGDLNGAPDLYEQAAAAARGSSLPEKDRFYWLSRIEYMMGRAYQNLERKKKADSHYEQGYEYIEHSVSAAGGDYSESWRMKSEIISQRCMVNGVGYILGNGLNVNKFAENALGMNPDNGKAIIIIASSKVYPPPIYGGNPKKGLALMEEASEKPDIEKDDLFNIYSGYAVAYTKMEDFDKARFWFESALMLYPHNAYVNEEYEKIR